MDVRRAELARLRRCGWRYGGLYLGVMAVLVLPGLLPFGSAERVATQILGLEVVAGGRSLEGVREPGRAEAAGRGR